MSKEIEELTDEDLIELWSAIGGTPHLFEYGKDELRHVLVTGECSMEYEMGGETKEAAIGLQLDYYTMAAIVKVLQARGFDTSTPVSSVSDGVIDKEILEKAVDDELCRIIKDDPAQMISHLLIQVGRLCVEANAATMDIKQQSDIEGWRREIKCKITTKKLKKLPPINGEQTM